MVFWSDKKIVLERKNSSVVVNFNESFDFNKPVFTQMAPCSAYGVQILIILSYEE